MRRRRATSTGQAWRWLQAAPLLVAVACGGPQELLGAGGKCFRDDECEAGLICVAPMEGDINRVCSNDPTPLISNVDGPPVMEPMAGAGAAAGAGGAMAGGGMGAMAAGGMGAMAAGGMGAMAGGGRGGAGAMGGTDTGGTAGSGGTDTAGSGGSAGSAGSAGSGGTEPEGGAPN